MSLTVANEFVFHALKIRDALHEMRDSEDLDIRNKVAEFRFSPDGSVNIIRYSIISKQCISHK